MNACEELFVPQLGFEDVTDGSVENYDLDWPLAEAVQETDCISDMPKTGK